MTGGPTADGHPGPVRGGAEPIAFDEPFERDEVEYLSDSHEVRYVAMYRRVGPPERGSQSREPVYETIPFRRWGRNRCASMGASRVGEVVREATGERKAISAGVFEQDDGRAISVKLVTTLGRSGEVVSEPSVAFDDLVAVTPRSVDATVRLADQEHAETVPVWVSSVRERLQ